MFGKIICEECKGNGYRMIWKDTDEKEKIAIDCNAIKVKYYWSKDLDLDITRTQ